MPNTPSSPLPPGSPGEPTSGCKDCDVHPERLCDAYPNCPRGEAEVEFAKRISTPRGIITPHGIMEIIPATPFRPDLLEPMSDEERREATQRYILEKYAKTMREQTLEPGDIDPTDIEGASVKSIAHYYDRMISRRTDGSDPLVQEPKD
jgi:hypothetical protein